MSHFWGQRVDSALFLANEGRLEQNFRASESLSGNSKEINFPLEKKNPTSDLLSIGQARFRSP